LRAPTTTTTIVRKKHLPVVREVHIRNKLAFLLVQVIKILLTFSLAASAGDYIARSLVDDTTQSEITEAVLAQLEV
jgi:hypothetical protein